MDVFSICGIQFQGNSSWRRDWGMVLMRARTLAKVYETETAFLEDDLPAVPGCLVVDIRLPDMSGLDFQDRIVSLGMQMPIILMTGHAGADAH
jgi:FixJ family two-component response regulator